jgi:hypothetical protein
MKIHALVKQFSCFRLCPSSLFYLDYDILEAGFQNVTLLQHFEFQPFSVSSGPETQVFFKYFSMQPSPKLHSGMGHTGSWASPNLTQAWALSQN